VSTHLCTGVLKYPQESAKLLRRKSGIHDFPVPRMFRAIGCNNGISEDFLGGCNYEGVLGEVVIGSLKHIL
jgi:hypothetical protein